MGKSVYSLVLSDDTVKAADTLAYKLGISRSALIDRILAEHLSVQTPERRMRDIMETFATLFDSDIFRLQTAGSDGSMQIRSPLPYKYKPTIRYFVELFGEGDYLGQLKISFRTQNAALLSAAADFWRTFAKIEASVLGGIGADMRVVYRMDGDKTLRLLNHPVVKSGRENLTADDIANAIADYVRFLDKEIKLYFEYEDKATAARLIDSEYRERIKSISILI